MSHSSRRSEHSSSSRRIDPTKNFRDEYRTPDLSNDQRRQIQKDQRDYDRMPSGGHREVSRAHDRLEYTQDKWEGKSAAREREYERTEPARMARADRTHPDIRSRK
jgi:phage protein D